MAGLKAEIMSGKLVVDSMRNKSDEMEGTYSSISTNKRMAYCSALMSL
jgi:hypothetical protein